MPKTKNASPTTKQNSLPKRVAFPDLPEVTWEYEERHEVSVRDACKKLARVLEYNNRGVLLSYANTLNRFHWEESWGDPNEMLSEMNSLLETLYTTSQRLLAMAWGPDLFTLNEQWIAGLKSSPKTTKQPAAEP